jgi:hypothetical protein
MWESILSRASPGLYLKLWTVRSAGAVIEDGKIKPGLLTQEEWDEVVRPHLAPYANEIKFLLKRLDELKGA